MRYLIDTNIFVYLTMILNRKKKNYYLCHKL